MILAILLFFSAWFHHAKPPAPDPRIADLHRSTMKYAKATIDKSAAIVKDHPELVDQEHQVWSDLEALLDADSHFEDDPKKYGALMSKDIDRVQDDFDKLAGLAWALEHFNYT